MSGAGLLMLLHAGCNKEEEEEALGVVLHATRNPTGCTCPAHNTRRHTGAGGGAGVDTPLRPANTLSTEQDTSTRIQLLLKAERDEEVNRKAQEVLLFLLLFLLSLAERGIHLFTTRNTLASPNPPVCVSFKHRHIL